MTGSNVRNRKRSADVKNKQRLPRREERSKLRKPAKLKKRKRISLQFPLLARKLTSKYNSL